MNIPQDPMMLYSFLNMKLRDEYASLDELCDSLDLQKEEVLDKMKLVGFEYNAHQNRFW